MTEGRKIAAILVADIVGYSRLIGVDEEGTLARLRALRSEFFNPTIEAHGGRVVKRMGDGVIVEFRSVVESIRCALDVTQGLAERNRFAPPDERIEVRTGIHLGDIVEEADGDLVGDGVNIAARLEGICEPGAICLSEDAWRQVRDKLPEAFVDLGEHELKNIVRPMRVYALGGTAGAPPATIDPQPPPETRAAPGIPAAIGALERVARLTEGYPDGADALRKEFPRQRRRRGLVKAVGILETVERFIRAESDQAAEPDAGPPNPPHPATAPGEGPGALETTGRREDDSGHPRDGRAASRRGRRRRSRLPPTER